MGVLKRNLARLQRWSRGPFTKHADIVKQPVFVVAFTKNENAAIRLQIERAFAFASTNERLKFTSVAEDIGGAELLALAPAKMLFVGVLPSREQLRVLKQIDTPFSEVSPMLDIDGEVPKEFAMRGSVAEVVGRRNSVYVHKPNWRHLPVVLNAYLDARRQYPDLLLMISGVEARDIERHQLDLNIIDEDANKSKRQIGDVLINSTKEFCPSWAAVANLCVLLKENSELEALASSALGSGSALLLYQVDLEEFNMLSELEAIGAIWSAQRPNLLAAAMTQALSPEKSALTVVQSLERLTAMNRPMLDAIDALLNRE